MNQKVSNFRGVNNIDVTDLRALTREHDFPQSYQYEIDSNGDSVLRAVPRDNLGLVDDYKLGNLIAAGIDPRVVSQGSSMPCNRLSGVQPLLDVVNSLDVTPISENNDSLTSN